VKTGWPRPDLHPPCAGCGRRWFYGHAADCTTRASYSPASLPRVREVTLSEADEAWALEIGRARNENALRRGFKPILPGSDTAAGDALGARGELAAARAYELEWRDPYRHDVQHMHDPDVGDLDVRTVERAAGTLNMRPRDVNDRVYLLVVAEGRRRYRMAGWLLGREAKQDEFWRPADARGPGWWAVPQDALRDPWSVP